MSTQPANVESIFFETLERTTPEERAAYLDAACAGDPTLRRRVEALLKAHQAAGSFLEVPLVAVEPRSADADENAPSRLTEQT